MPAEANTPGSVRRAAFRRAQWGVLLATMFCYLFYYTGRQTFGFAIPGIEAELGIGKTVLGGVSGALLWSYAVGQAINGNLGDRFGGRRMMSLGAFLSCVLNWAVSFGHSSRGLLVPWVANGYAQAMGWAPGSRVLSNWWGRHERGRVYGFYVFAAGMSSILTFTTSNAILALGLDWRWIFRLPVLLLLLGGVVYYLAVRDTPEERGFDPPDDLEPETPDPGSAGIDCADGAAGASDSSSPVDADCELRRPAPADPATERLVGETWAERYIAVCTNWRFLVASLAIGFQNTARYGLLIWVPVHFLGESWKETPGGAWISLALPVGMALGALVSGWLSDRMFGGNRSRLIASFLALGGAASLGMAAAGRDPLAGIVLLFLCGFFAYGPQSAFWALCPDLLGRERAGTGTGVMNTFAYMLAGLGEVLIGWVIETNNDRTELIFPIVAASCLAGALIVLFVRR